MVGMMTQRSNAGEILVREAVPSSDTVRERFAAIDGLRAVAILAMLAYEAFAFAPGIAAGRRPLATALGDLSQGVTLFILLSGFALGYPAIVACTESGAAYLDIARYAIKRVLRIYPAFLLALALAIAIPPLARHFGIPAFAGGAKPVGIATIVSNLFFVGDGLGNDGFRGLATIARMYVLFPLLLLLWARSGPVFAGVMFAAAVLDTTTGLHAIGIGALVPFMLGMVAAGVRAQNLPAYRFGVPLALLAGTAAIVWSPGIAHLAASHEPAGTLRIDPLWSVSLFGALVAINAFGPIEEVLGFAPLRLLGVASYAISLAIVPVTAFTVRQLGASHGPLEAAGSAVVVSIVVGFALWQLVDRSFGESSLRRDVADRLAPNFSALLARVHADRVTIGKPAEALLPEIESASPQLETSFYAPPPRPDAADLAMVSQRSGSPEELAAEIIATKKRLAERSAALFVSAKPVEAPVTYQKPGFYRKPGANAIAVTTSRADEVVPAEPIAVTPVPVAPPSYATPVATTVPMINTLPIAATDSDDHEVRTMAPTLPPVAERSPIKVRIGAPRAPIAEPASVERLDG